MTPPEVREVQMPRERVQAERAPRPRVNKQSLIQEQIRSVYMETMQKMQQNQQEGVPKQPNFTAMMDNPNFAFGENNGQDGSPNREFELDKVAENALR